MITTKTQADKVANIIADAMRDVFAENGEALFCGGMQKVHCDVIERECTGAKAGQTFFAMGIRIMGLRPSFRRIGSDAEAVDVATDIATGFGLTCEIVG